MNHRFPGAALLLLSGCAVNLAAQRPQALGNGNFEASIEPSVAARAGGVNASCCVPLFNSSFRWGVGDSTDIGFRLGTSGIRLLSKFQLSEGRTVVAVAPEVGGMFTATGGTAGLDVPLLIGAPIGERDQFLLEPGLNITYGASGDPDDRAPEFVVALALGTGVSVWPVESVGLIPSLAFLIPVHGVTATYADGVSTSVGGAGIGFQLGVMLGTPDRM